MNFSRRGKVGVMLARWQCVVLLRRHAEELAGVGALDFHADWQTGDIHQLMFGSKRAVHETRASRDRRAVRQICRGWGRGCWSHRWSAWRRLGHGSHIAVGINRRCARAFRSRSLGAIGSDVGGGCGDAARNQEGALRVGADHFGASRHTAYINEAWRVGERSADVSGQVWHCLCHRHGGGIQHGRRRCRGAVRADDWARGLHRSGSLCQRRRSTIAGSQRTAIFRHVIG